MKKNLLTSLCLIAMISCNNTSSESRAIDDTSNSANPVTIDTTKKPGGMDNSSVISTDTAAMNVQKSIEKRDSAKSKRP